MPKIPVALQLYTVRDRTKTDFAGTVKEVARIGYAGVELAGYGNLTTAKDVRKALDDAGLKLAGAHVGIDALEKDLPRVLDDQHILGNRNVVCPYMPEPRRKDAAGWKQVAESLSQIATRCREKGFTFAYHNHSFEFQVFDGKTGMDILWDNTDAAMVRSELDVFWVKHGGIDPVDYLKELGKRVALLHLKDMATGPERKFAPVGTGTIDFSAIDAAAQQIGVQWNIVEQDDPYGQSSLEIAKISFENLKKAGIA